MRQRVRQPIADARQNTSLIHSMALLNDTGVAEATPGLVRLRTFRCGTNYAVRGVFPRSLVVSLPADCIPGSRPALEIRAPMAAMPLCQVTTGR